jgi:hypothetical protein
MDGLIAEAIKGADGQPVVGETIVAAVTDTRPKPRYPAGTLARRVSKLRRYVPTPVFDRQIRKLNRLAGWAALGFEASVIEGRPTRRDVV